MKSWVVLLSIKVAVITLSSTFSLIFILSVPWEDVSVGGAAIGASVDVAVGAAVGCGLMGVAAGALGIGGTAVSGRLVGAAGGVMCAGGAAVGGNCVGVGAGAQATTTAAAKMSLII
jgi:hypothetical protein